MSSWNRRDFIAKPLAAVAGWQLLSHFNFLSAQESKSPAATPAKQPIFRTLGKTGISLPIVSMGVMNADVPGLVRRAYELGMRHFDTAGVYQNGRNEEMLGSVIKEMKVRDKVTIATKSFVPDWNRGLTQPQAKAKLLELFDASLRRLQMDYVDILYCHSVDSVADANAEGPLEALTMLKKQGKARFIGMSSHRGEMMLNEAMKLGVLDVILLTINYTMASDRGLLDTIDKAAQKGIGIVAMKTQAGGLSKPDAKLPKVLPPHSQSALLKWVVRNPSITTAIPGFTTYDQLEQNFAVASNLEFTAPEKEFLADKTFKAEAEFCRQCGECRPDCPKQVDVPSLMRSHMYAVQYANLPLSRDILTRLPQDRGLAACMSCETCQASCRNTVNIDRKIAQLKELSSFGQQILA